MSRRPNVSVLDFLGAKDDGGGDNNRSYKLCRAPVESSRPTYQQPTLYRPDALPVIQPTMSGTEGRKYRILRLAQP